MDPDFITVVGGLGGMGSAMAACFSQAGLNVRVADKKQGSIDWQEVGQSPVVLLAVPLGDFEGVLKDLGPHTRPDGVVIDISSLKKREVSAMLENCQGDVVGTHPLFGPKVRDLHGQVVYVCPGRGEQWQNWLIDLLQNQGAKVEIRDPGEHDRLMARIQVLRHFMLVTFGLSLTRLDFDVKELLPISGVWFTQLIEMLKSQLEQNHGLYADLALNNPAASEVLDEFARSAIEISRLVTKGDRDGLMELFDLVTRHIDVESAE
jgi:prephenate dehydrogenase